MPAPVTPVRPATPEDVPAAVRTLARAFADYPFTRHVVAADDHPERVRRFQELFLTRVAMEYGRAWVTDDRRAVAAWTTPERDPGPAFAEVGPLAVDLAGDRAAALGSAEQALAPHRPTGPVWFLATVGVDPDAQGAGLGTAVLRPGLEAAERGGFPAFLETSDEGNVRFYARLGFEVTAEVTLPDGGPRTWCMRRDPVP
ncbi:MULTISPECIES: GNAT family N-acetyltransferase [unclassified Streptomyces]|uniref:GNAT family N-acetyltransferase n=1 Tax=unclassified Streptomyces TaxID=2593676 RepID=UPI00234992EF|nr:GNAT family N-acetyltransferase [Streptomyces sp. M92]WCN05525.1 GNAT family N-acetyltransferase [Streptomyces sp. M92]